MARKNLGEHHPTVIAQLLPSPAGSDRAAWDAAWKHYTAEKAAFDRHEAEFMVPAVQAWEDSLPEQMRGSCIGKPAEVRAIRDANWAVFVKSKRLEGLAIDEWSDILADNVSEAKDALLKLPAPDLRALMWKLEELFGSTYDWGAASSDSLTMDWVGPFVEDARRLLQGRAEA